MPYQEKENIVSIISTSLVYALYCIYVFQKYQEGGLDPINDFRFWGSVILILIPVNIVINIIITIVFTIINTIVTKEKEDPSFTDERDEIIGLKATRNSYVVVGVGFLLSMVTLVMGLPPFVMFNIVFFSFIVAGIFGNISQLYYYRRGV